MVNNLKNANICFQKVALFAYENWAIEYKNYSLFLKRYTFVCMVLVFSLFFKPPIT